MRLLHSDSVGELRLTDDLARNEVPRYAILSHRWLASDAEPTFADLCYGRGKEKLGYRKLEFCAQQARLHGLEHFWADTCCINKDDNAELSRSIKSMFRWYENAAVCYVYLADVPDRPFSKSVWFTRGWTLQELLAPRTVLFYSADGLYLGDKGSLEQQIQQVTNIPSSALQGKSLHSFTENERLAWRQNRETAREEDKVYSLLGIFDVDITPMYGERFTHAFQRLRDELKKRESCIRDLCITDPRQDKKRIEETKGGILADCYGWIVDNPCFVQWRSQPQNQLLWIRGDPGKGKTMLLCGIIDELEAFLCNSDHLSYFFCQAGDVRINNATSILRGLITMLVEQQPSLSSHVLEQYDRHGKALFENANTWIALSDIFRKIIQDPGLKPVMFIIDALDECIASREHIVKVIHEAISISRRVKWIISSRNWPDIEEQLTGTGDCVALNLELNSEAVSEAVQAYITHRVAQLTIQKKYNDITRNAVERHLSLNADGTFLWVALVCEHLAKVPRRHVLAKLNEFPPGLNALYTRMWEHIRASDDASLCQQILAAVAVVFRPITLQELPSIVKILEPFCNDDTEIMELVGLCGSFLTVRESTVYFVHQSAKDFLLREVSVELFPDGRRATHQSILSMSLQSLSTTLKRDMYRLSAPGYAIENIERPDPDPLVRLRYSSSHWIDHFGGSISDIAADRAATDQFALVAVEDFLKRRFLYWLECLSLCRKMSEGVLLMRKLQALLKVSSTAYSQRTDELMWIRQLIPRRPRLSLYKMHVASSCITSRLSRVIRFRCI
jgi:hypothetical protein